MKEIMKKVQGITLVALVITIIVMLILAGVGISFTTGILKRAKYARFLDEMAKVKESVTMKGLETQLNTLGESGGAFSEAMEKSDWNEIEARLKYEIAYSREKAEGIEGEKLPTEEYYKDYIFEEVKDENGQGTGSIAGIFFVDKEMTTKGDKAYIYDEGSSEVYRLEPEIIEGVPVYSNGMGGLLLGNGGLLGKLQDDANKPESPEKPELPEEPEVPEVPVEADKRKTKQIVAGDNHVLALDAEGHLLAWGDNQYGQLGDGTTKNKLVPVQIGDRKYSQITAGYNHSLAIDMEGYLWAWGHNESNQLGDGSTSNRNVPTKIGDRKYKKVAGGRTYSFAIDEEGYLWNWGSANIVVSETNDKTVPTRKKGDERKYSDIVSGGSHVLAIDGEGFLWTWGYNYYGQLGDSTTNDRWSAPAQITNRKYSQIEAGYNHSLAIDTEGYLWAWGDNGQGQLGDRTTTQRNSPVVIENKGKYSQVKAGINHSLAIDSEGYLWTWGHNGRGQLGDGTDTNKVTPTKTTAEIKCSQMAAGKNSSFFIDTDGYLWTCGDNTYGQLGNGTMTNQAVLASYNKPELPPVEASNRLIQEVAAGYNHSLAIDTEGHLWAWGDNQYGQLGDGTISNRTMPKKIGTKTYSKIATYNHSLAIDKEGYLWAWGYNGSGQLGNGTATNQLTPQKIGEKKYVQIAVGKTNSFAIDTEGYLWAWGSNSNGQLGDGTTTIKKVPTQIGTNKYTQIASSGNHSLAIDTEGYLWAWGSNSAGQLNDYVNNATQKNSPTKIDKNKYTQIAAGDSHSLAIDTEGYLWGGGSNEYGQLRRWKCRGEKIFGKDRDSQNE